MHYNSHGGSCCGYGHVYSFDHAGPQHLRECITQHEAAAGGVNRILEAILTDRQLAPVDNDNRVHMSVRDEGGWAAILAREGFRLAAQWQNSNTGRNCYQFLRIPTLLTDTAGYVPPFNWTGEVVVATPPPLARVATEYYANLRVGGRRGPFLTLAAAREAYPRCQRFDRRTIYSNGVSEYVDANQ